jgi:hypothetical protein
VSGYESYLSLIVIAVVILVVYLAVRVEKRRREQMRRQAALLGFSFEEQRALDAEPYRRLPVFGRGRRQRIRNVLRRSSGREETFVFDFSFSQGSGKSSNRYWLTIVLQRFSGLSLPRFELRPEVIVYKVASWLGLQDVDFPDDPEFSSKYLLRGEDEKRIREIFSVPVRLQLRERTGWSVEAEDEWLAVYQGMRRIKAHEIGKFISEAEQVSKAIAESYRSKTAG